MDHRELEARVALPLSRAVDLAAGLHTLRVEVEGPPGLRVAVSVEVPGPVVDELTPLTGPTGTAVTLRGEGFFAPLQVLSGSTQLAAVSVASRAQVTAKTVASMPSGPLTVATPFGSTHTRQVFTPLAPVLSERQQVQTVPGAPSLALGLDCSQAQTSCLSGVCLKMSHGLGTGSFCSKECRTERDCPTGWFCRSLQPGSHGFLCVAENWQSRAVGVRP